MIQGRELGKCYKLYARPFDRLREALSFGGKVYHQDFWALREVSFSVTQGESWGVIGENGAGKSTLLKLVAGVTRPNQGSLEVTGRVGALLELGTGFHPEYTGRENIYFSAAMMGLSKSETEALLPEIIDFSGLGDFIDRPVKTYSTGMFMRLGFSVATTINPDVLITDEVLAVGDESFQKKCVRRMEAFLAQGKSLLFCSHSMYHVRKLCQKAIWLDHGQVRALGDVAEVTNSYEDYVREMEIRAQPKEEMRENQYPSDYSRLWVVRLLNVAGQETARFKMGDSARLEIIAETPDGIAPVVVVGLVRNDKTPIYGVFSDFDKVRPKEIGNKRFRVVYELLELSLLPGSYTFRAHVLDPPGLRLFDTVEKDFAVQGDTREIGICRLPHRWVI
ncbi:MAG TPA: ABC transporter ATP-binding protein [Candidatus Binatia bacterium]|nr:ABC transporter ATP-binding protein [Candidatus Binatia bacterium]